MAVGGGGPEKDLAEELYDWSSKEMHFLPQGPYLGRAPPTVQQLRRICRGSHQVDLWNFVIANVHSVQTVKKVKGNLQLKARSQRHGYTVQYKSDGRYDDEQQQLLTQREQLQGEMTALQSEIRQLEEEMQRMESDLHGTEVEYQREQEGVRDLGRRACLLQLYAHTADNFTAAVDAFSDRVQAKTDAVVLGRKGVDTALHSREEEGGGEKRSTQLETSVARDVRTSCEHISQFLHQTLQGTFGKDKASFQLSKDQLWKQVETTLREHNIEQIVNALVHQSKQEGLLLREHTVKINIQKDAEKLRFKYEKGGVLRDVSTQPSVLQSVQQLLEENQLRHVVRFVETEKHRNAARPFLQRLDSTRSKIDSQLKQLFSADPGNAHMAMQLVQCQLEVVGERTAREVYRGEGESVREKISREQAHRDVLLTLHHKIQHFQDLANSKQTLIQVVAKQNAGAKSRLTAQHADVTAYIGRSMPAHPLETQRLTEELKGTVVEEVNRLSALSLPYLLYVYLDSETKRGLLDLSVNFTTHPAALSVRQPLHSILNLLQFPPYKAPECVLKECVRQKGVVEGGQQRTQAENKQASAVQLASGLTTHIDNLPELCEKVRGRDREELEKLLPQLQKRLNRAANASTECITMKDSVHSWWEQPAQFTTSWVKAEDLTYQQWFNKWKIIATKIRQLDLPH